MKFLNKIKINLDGETHTLVIGYSDVVISIILSSEGRLQIKLVA